MSLILTRPGCACPCPPTTFAQFCINFRFTDGTPDQIPLINLFLPVKTTTGLLNFVSGVLGFVPYNEANGNPNGVPVVLCNPAFLP